MSATLTEKELRGPPKTMTLWIERVSGEGQDAPPVVMLSDDGQFGILGVFDGMGGRGGEKYTFRDGTYAGCRLDGTYAGAWLAARCCAQTLVDYVKDAENGLRQSRAAMQPWPDDDTIAHFASDLPDVTAPEARQQMDPAPEARATVSDGDRIDVRIDVPVGAALSVKKLGEWFDQRLRQLANELPTSEAVSRVRAKVIRKLPTTIAAASFEVGEMLNLRAFWAGDSRCYYLTENGLAQLTADDTKLNPDSWDSLLQDAPLTNYLSEEKNQLRDEHFRLPLPGVLICCTDGAWGFVGSPMHLEEIILYSITDKLPVVNSVRRLAEHFRSVAGDDVSLIIHPVGFHSLQEMQAYFASRRERVSRGYIAPLDEAAHRLDKAKTHKRVLDEELEKQKRAIVERLERQKEEIEKQKREVEERAAKESQEIERRRARDKHQTEAALATAQEHYNDCLQRLWENYKVNYYDNRFRREPK